MLSGKWLVVVPAASRLGGLGSEVVGALERRGACSRVELEVAPTAIERGALAAELVGCSPVSCPRARPWRGCCRCWRWIASGLRRTGPRRRAP